MKICLINNLYGAYAKGGAERIVQTEADTLARMGHDVIVISSRPAAAAEGGVCEPDAACRIPDAKIREFGVVPRNLYFYADGHRHGWPVRLAWHLADVFGRSGPLQVMKIVDRERPDVVHTHNLMGVGFRLPRMLRRGGWRHVHTVHDVQLVNPSGQIPAVGSSPIMQLAERLHVSVLCRVFGSPDTVVFPSEFMRRFHAERGFFRQSRVAVVENPAPEIRHPNRERPGGATRFLFVGQLDEHKGVGVLLEAWAASALEGATLEIIGRGGLESAVSDAARRDDSIVYRGRLKGEALEQAYLSASFCVVPSLVLENSPTVIAEAFAAGTPVVAFATGGIPESVSDGETGILATIGGGRSRGKAAHSRSVSSFVSALQTAAALSPDAWQLMSERCRKLAASRSAESHIERLLCEYRPSSDTNRQAR